MKRIAVLAFAGVMSSVGLFGAPAIAADLTTVMGSSAVVEDLDSLRAKGVDSVTEQIGSATMTDSAIIGNTGTNSIASSFGSSQGVYVVGQNSGNNVSFQQAVTMTIRVGN